MLAPAPAIPEWFSGKNVLITGATGFLGKALIEKLLRSCPRIGDIYVLLRPKRGKQHQERIAALVTDSLYDRLKKEQPNLIMEDKIIPLAGDVAELNLGISPEERQTLVENVHIIFHVAASVRFDDPLKEAVLMNVRGTREACQLALDAKHLVAHVHVSTAFANCDRPEAEEVLYPPKIDWRKMIEIAEKFDKYTLNILTDKFKDGMPNTYCFTKNIAEHVAHDMMKGQKPCTIFRPSIVVSTLREEPVAGWIDNFNGPMGILVAYGKGLLRTLYATAKYKPDYVPADIVTKSLIVSSWDIATRHPPLESAPCVPEVLHCTSHNSAEWLRPSVGRLTNYAFEANCKIPLNDIMWTPSKHTTTNRLVWNIRTVFCMLLPALMVDGMLKIMGKEPRLTKLQKKIYCAQIALRHFMNNEWIYSNDNLLALQDRIQEGDKADWDYEFRDYPLEKYVEQAILGCRRYLLKETDDTLPQAKQHYNRMLILHKIFQFIGIMFLFWIMWKVGFLNNYG